MLAPAWRGSGTARYWLRPSRCVGTRRASLSCPQRPPERSGADSRSSGRDHFPAATVPVRLLCPRCPAHAELSAAERAAQCGFSDRHRHRHPRSCALRGRCLGPRCATGVIRGRGRRAAPEGRAAVTAAEESQPERVGGWGRKRRPQAEAPGLERARGDAAANARGRPAAGAPNKGTARAGPRPAGVDSALPRERGRQGARRGRRRREARGRPAGGQQAGLRRL